MENPARIDQLTDAPSIASGDFLHLNKAGTDYRIITSRLSDFTDQIASEVVSVTTGNNLTGLEVQDNIDELSDRGNLATVRYSKLDNPLLSILKKNELVNTIDGPLSWRRLGGGVSSYVDRYGIVRYSPTDNTTNLVLRSEELDNVYWGKLQSSSIISNVSIAPDGTMTADKFISGSTIGRIQSSDIVVTSTVVTLSAFVKKGTTDLITLSIADSGVTNGANLWVNIKKLSVGDNTSFGTGYDTLYGGISEDDNGNIRVQATFSIPASSTIKAFFRNTNTDGVLDSLATDFNYWWGIQVEESRVANGYLKTTTTSTTGTSTFGINQPREESEGWLIEGASDNLALHSEDFTDAVWTKVSIGAAIVPVVTSNVGIAPDGALTADRVFFDITVDNTNNRSLLRQAVTFATTATFSIWLKSNTGSDQEIHLVIGGATQTGITITNVWTRYVLHLDTFGAGVVVGLELRGLNGSSSITSDLLVWGGQAEDLPFASSYIPTTTSTTIRSAEVVSFLIDSNFLSGVQGDHSQFIKYKLSGDTGVNTYLYSSEAEGGINNSFTITSLVTTGVTRYRDGSSGVGEESDTLPATIGVEHISATVTEGSTIRAYSDAVFNETITFTPTTVIDLTKVVTIGSDITGAIPFYGHMRDFLIYDFALNEDEVKFLSD